MAGKAAGWVEWMIRRAVFIANVRDFYPLHVPDVRVKSAALLCVD
jgi:hypothetical protein